MPAARAACATSIRRAASGSRTTPSEPACTIPCRVECTGRRVRRIERESGTVFADEEMKMGDVFPEPEMKKAG
ncbi:hypothetical protein G3N64_05460 [Burkholderia sp. Ac-20344]|nr:hypothetical protein [Burkholderia sp. Ac-20344]